MELKKEKRKINIFSILIGNFEDPVHFCARIRQDDIGNGSTNLN